MVNLMDSCVCDEAGWSSAHEWTMESYIIDGSMSGGGSPTARRHFHDRLATNTNSMIVRCLIRLRVLSLDGWDILHRVSLMVGMRLLTGYDIIAAEAMTRVWFSFDSTQNVV